MKPEIDTDRLSEVKVLAAGAHREGAEMCAMEAVAYIAREPWSDHTACSCPVLSAFMRSWNDWLPEDERTAILLPFIPRLVGTKGSPALEQRRATMSADWLIRVHTVAWLRLAKLDKQADLLASLPEITDFAQCPSLMPALEAVRTDAYAAWDAARDAAWDAAWDAARAAAWDAAWAAAWAAAWDAAWDAAWAAGRAAAWDAAWDAARAAAWDAARAAAWDAGRDAARDAAWDGLSKTKKELQVSAADLLSRMIELKDEDKAA